MDRNDEVLANDVDTDAQLAERAMFWQGNGPGPDARAALEKRRGKPLNDWELEQIAAGRRYEGDGQKPEGNHYAADGTVRHPLSECRPGQCWTDEPKPPRS